MSPEAAFDAIAWVWTVLAIEGYAWLHASSWDAFRDWIFQRKYRPSPALEILSFAELRTEILHLVIQVVLVALGMFFLTQRLPFVPTWTLDGLAAGGLVVVVGLSFSAQFGLSDRRRFREMTQTSKEAIIGPIDGI